MVRTLADYVIAVTIPTSRRSRPLSSLRSRGSARRTHRAVDARRLHPRVMNTDNMTVSGETIDWTCAFIEAYDPRTVFSRSDAHGRVRQPAEDRALEPGAPRRKPAAADRLIDGAGDRARDEVIDAFSGQYASLARGRCAKLGLAAVEDDDARSPPTGCRCWSAHGRLHAAWRRLGDSAGGTSPLAALFAPAAPRRNRAMAAARRAGAAQRVERRAAMHRVNPLYVPRKRVEGALAAAASEPGIWRRSSSSIVTHPFDGQGGKLTPSPPARVTARYRRSAAPDRSRAAEVSRREPLHLRGPVIGALSGSVSIGMRGHRPDTAGNVDSEPIAIPIQPARPEVARLTCAAADPPAR
jgi:hypothetical protein